MNVTERADTAFQDAETQQSSRKSLPHYEIFRRDAVARTTSNAYTAAALLELPEEGWCSVRELRAHLIERTNTRSLKWDSLFYHLEELEALGYVRSRQIDNSRTKTGTAPAYQRTADGTEILPAARAALWCAHEDGISLQSILGRRMKKEGVDSGANTRLRIIEAIAHRPLTESELVARLELKRVSVLTQAIELERNGYIDFTHGNYHPARLLYLGPSGQAALETNSVTALERIILETVQKGKATQTTVAQLTRKSRDQVVPTVRQLLEIGYISRAIPLEKCTQLLASPKAGNLVDLARTVRAVANGGAISRKYAWPIPRKVLVHALELENERLSKRIDTDAIIAQVNAYHREHGRYMNTNDIRLGFNLPRPTNRSVLEGLEREGLVQIDRSTKPYKVLPHQQSEP